MSQLRLSEGKERRLARLVARGGAAVHLVPDTLLATQDILNNLPAACQGYNACQEIGDALFWLTREPLVAALQDGRAAVAAVQCQHCQPAKPLRMQFFNRSGSTAETLSDLIIGKKGTSDFDVMIQFGGPFRWAVGAGIGARRIDPEAAPQLWAKTTDNPGFVTLHWVRTSQCRHEAPLAALSAESVRQLMRHFCRVQFSSDDITCSGPAVNVKPPDVDCDGQDFVPCLFLPWWPAEETFLSRRRVTDFPPEAVRRGICRFGIHLVPTGRPGSDTEQTEWRMSFSRAEVVAVRHFSAVQHATVTTVKRMTKILKGWGLVAAPKSYYIKTAVLWLVQCQPSTRWTGVTAGVHMVLDWLKLLLTTGRIPCFFWPAINLVAGLSRAELNGMIQTIHLMMRQATLLLLACCEDMGWDLNNIMGDGTEPLPERELQLRLARELVMQAVLEGIAYRSTAPCWDHWMNRFIPSFARADQLQLLWWLYRRDSGAYHQQCRLLQAMAVAPADLVSGDAADVTRR